jgi:hypothetical protein
MPKEYYCRKKKKPGKCAKACAECDRAVPISIDNRGRRSSRKVSDVLRGEDPFYIDRTFKNLHKKLKDMGWV